MGFDWMELDRLWLGWPEFGWPEFAPMSFELQRVLVSARTARRDSGG
jgi:hypothetical protein